MSCNSCKDPKKKSNQSEVVKKSDKVVNTVINLILYLIALSVTSIVIIPLMAFVLFRVIVLGRHEYDVVPLALKLFKSKNKGNDKNDDDDDDEEDDIENLDEEYFKEVEVLNNK